MENQKTPITINDVEHHLEDMTPEQQQMVNHIADLDRKIRSAAFNLEQLQFGRQAFVNSLTNSLTTEETEEAA